MPCGTHQSTPPLLILQVIGIIGNGLCPAKRRKSRHNEQERQKEGTERINVRNGVERQAPGKFCGGIAQHIGNRAMRNLVNDDRYNKDGEIKKKRDKIHRSWNMKHKTEFGEYRGRGRRKTSCSTPHYTVPQVRNPTNHPMLSRMFF